MKICSKCKTRKPAAQFPNAKRYAPGLYCWCQKCVHEYNCSPERVAHDRARRKTKFADPETRKAYNTYRRNRYNSNPQERRRHKDEMYQRKYDITLEFFESEIKKQHGRCKLCGKRRRLVADHNHKTKKYRGAICGLCNVAVGRIELVPNFILKVQEYIQ